MINSSEIWAELMKKYNVFHLHKPFDAAKHYIFLIDSSGIVHKNIYIYIFFFFFFFILKKN